LIVEKLMSLRDTSLPRRQGFAVTVNIDIPGSDFCRRCGFSETVFRLRVGRRCGCENDECGACQLKP
jgi:hypothetical protein